MARKKSNRSNPSPPGVSGAGHAALKLVRVDNARGGMHLVFDNAGTEHRWKLEPVSVREMLALLLRGEMRKGPRVILKGAEASVEPPEKRGDAPVVCVSLGHVELCFTMERGELGALGKDIAQALKA